VHGPNGFFREFAGNPGLGAEVAAQDDGRSGQVTLVLSNTGKKPVRLRISDAYGNDRSAAYRLEPGDSVDHVANPGQSHGWYDLSVTSDQDAAYLRRVAGHVETGRPSASDPAIATA
jgi:phospholipase C